ncbi:hypothetical protein HELRODRAFT_93602 [Helobdella robusta]|uniref:non-specific serine/threonine protein kinase n=1 Tax=Helobdella robusta TaxID=6412 RepID=T1G8W7_HELRO|nr:hypothetical protein HELRODRAFT_93602 [Helobdella robusta]ESO13013.1 hypothetical protein HELRODRAFT_93602 [Helobdella robusta]
MKKAATKPKKVTSAYKMAPSMPEGMVLCDLMKNQWKIGAPVGSGGFGLIYLTQPASTAPVSKNAEFVMKIEPHENGPLFCETTFFQRVAKPDQVTAYMNSKGLKHLGVPKFGALGHHEKDGKKYRFMVIQRFLTDLQKMFESNNNTFPHHSIFIIGLQMLDTLEFIHSQGYAHADIKAANIMIGLKNSNQVFLIDYGLAFRFLVDGKHKEYKEDPKKAHDGTAEYASRDAHRGVWPSARGDLEILGYCMWQWLAGSLPWEGKIDDKNFVSNQKIRYMSNINSLIGPLIKNEASSKGLCGYLNVIAKLKYDEKPNYEQLRSIFKSTLASFGSKSSEKLDLTSKSVTATSDSKAQFQVNKTPLKGRKRILSEENDNKIDVMDTKKTKVALVSKYKSPKRIQVRLPSLAKKTTPAKSNNKSSAEKKKLKGLSSLKNLVVNNCNNNQVMVTGGQVVSPLVRKRKRNEINYNEDEDVNICSEAVDDDYVVATSKRVKRKNVPMAAIGTQTSPGLKGLPRSRNPINS